MRLSSLGEEEREVILTKEKECSRAWKEKKSQDCFHLSLRAKIAYFLHLLLGK